MKGTDSLSKGSVEADPALGQQSPEKLSQPLLAPVLRNLSNVC